MVIPPQAIVIKCGKSHNIDMDGVAEFAPNRRSDSGNAITALQCAGTLPFARDRRQGEQGWRA
jgi:hypothetical protein